MSSDDSSTTVTVVSAAWPAARRCVPHRQDVAHPALGLALSLLLDLANPTRGVVLGLLLYLLEQQLLGPAGRQARDLLERALEFLAGLHEVRSLLVDLCLFARDRLLTTRDGGGAFEHLRVEIGIPPTRPATQGPAVHHLYDRCAGGRMPGGGGGRCRPGAVHPAV